MIDLHCHLDLYPDPAAIARECDRRGMFVLSVTTTPSAWSGTVALEAGTGRIRTAVGLHPQLARERKGELVQFERLLGETRYVGEVGLDRTPECLPFWNDQVQVFENVLAACATAGGKILTIHSRRAEDEVLDRLKRQPGAGTPVLHWFSGNRRSLQHAIDLGCWFSVGPAMLRTAKGQALVERMPIDRVLTESDGPFALQGDRALLPWDVESAVKQLGTLWAMPALEVQERLLQNLRTLVESAVGTRPA